MNQAKTVSIAVTVLMAMFFALLLAPTPAAAQGLAIVSNGVSRAPIVIPAESPPFTVRAAHELTEYIERISGARPEVIEGLPQPVPEHAIWVGYQPKLDSLFPGISFEFEHPEEILIAANENHVVIAGRDLWDPDHLTVEYPVPRGGGNPGGRGTQTVHGVQKEYGTANAVYTFMQDYLDVRWLWPGELGIDVIERDTIRIEPTEYRYHPQFRSRAGIFNFSMMGVRGGISHDWSRYQRLYLDSLEIEAWHTFNTWWKQYHEQHPEFFALQPDGTRSGWPAPGAAKLCVSNPAVWQHWFENEFEVEHARDPNKRVFNASFNDGSFQGFCICKDCLAWDHPEGEKVFFSWSGVGQNYVAMSDRYVTYANKLGQMLKDHYPDEDYHVSIMAYGVARPAPVEAMPADNVIVAGVFNFHNRKDIGRGQFSDEHKRMFEDWAKLKIPNLAWRPNMGGAAGWQLGMPNVAPQRVIDDFRFVADAGVMGVNIDSVWEHWVNQGPHYYMLGQMGWNPYADGEAILEDYYHRAFGPAAPAMTDYWNLMADATDQIIFQDQPKEEVWNDAFYKQADAHLDRADELAAKAPDKYADRIAYVRAGLNYMRLYYETEALIIRLHQSRGEDTEAEAAAHKNWEKLDKIFKMYPLAFDPQRIATPTSASGVGRMRRIHPDYYEPFHSEAKR